MRDGYAVVVVAHLEESRKGIGLLVAPTWIGIVVERHRRGDALPHVEFAVGIKAAPLFLGFLAGQDKAPGNAAVGSLIDEDELLRRQRFDTELGILVLGIARNIREGGVRGELDIGLRANVAFCILPVINLETPRRGLVAQSHIDVRCRTYGIKLGSVVHVCHTILTGVIGIGTTLAVVGSKGDAVVVNAKVFLVICLSRPPLRSGSSGRTATHVGYFFVGDAPFLTRNLAEVGCVVNLRLVESVSLLHARLTETVTVSQFQFHGMCTGLGVLVAHLRECRVCRAVQDPNRINTWLRRESGHHLIRFLIHIELEVHSFNSGYALGISALKAVWRASGQRSSKTAPHQTCADYIIYLCFHIYK